MGSPAKRRLCEQERVAGLRLRGVDFLALRAGDGSSALLPNMSVSAWVRQQPPPTATIPNILSCQWLRDVCGPLRWNTDAGSGWRGGADGS